MNAELLALRDRVAKGNEKLHAAWAQMKNLDAESWKQASRQYDEALKKLELLCLELKGKGYQDCLYIKFYEGMTMEEERAIMSEIASGKVTDIKKVGAKTKNCLINEDKTFFCRVCPCASGKALWYSEQELFNEACTGNSRSQN